MPKKQKHFFEEKNSSSSSPVNMTYFTLKLKICMYLMRECVMSFVRSLALLLSIIGKKSVWVEKKVVQNFQLKELVILKKMKILVIQIVNRIFFPSDFIQYLVMLKYKTASIIIRRHRKKFLHEKYFKLARGHLISCKRKVCSEGEPNLPNRSININKIT